MVNKAKRSLMKSALSHLAGDLSSVRGPAEKGKIMRWREMQRQQAQLFQADIDTLGQNQAQVRFFIINVLSLNTSQKLIEYIDLINSLTYFWC